MDLNRTAGYPVPPTVEEIKENHVVDLAVQHKYGVRMIEYYINEKDGLVFCLMEAPNKEACAAVRAEVHSGMACTVIELEGSDYSAFMGTDRKVNKDDIVERTDGSFDTGERFVLSADLVGSMAVDTLYESLIPCICRWEGRRVLDDRDQLMLAFTEGGAAVRCAVELLQFCQSTDPSADIRIGVAAGRPVTQHYGSLFKSTIQLASYLTDAAPAGAIYLSNQMESCFPIIEAAYTKSKVLQPKEELLLEDFLKYLNKHLSDSSLSLMAVGQRICLSRAQLWRRMVALTGQSPAAFIADLRLRRAWHLLHRESYSISEVAYQVGFSNPSYFTQQFKKRFGRLPSQILEELTP